jgi:hypothetical protein
MSMQEVGYWNEIILHIDLNMIIDVYLGSDSIQLNVFVVRSLKQCERLNISAIVH